MALTVTNKLTNTSMDPQLVKVLQDLENRIPIASTFDSHFTVHTGQIGEIGFYVLVIADDRGLSYGQPVIGLILCKDTLITTQINNYDLYNESGGVPPTLGGYMYFCGNGWIEEPFRIQYGASSGSYLSIMHMTDQKIEFTNALLIGNTI